MADYFGTYNPTKIVFTVSPPTGAGGVSVPVAGFAGLSIASGRAADSFVAGARSNDAFTMVIGADGDGSHVRSNDKSGPVTLVLHHGSAFNSGMSLLINAQENEDIPDFTVRITATDMNSNPPSVMTGSNCKITVPAPFERGASDGSNTWTFLPHKLSFVHNGRQ